MDFKREKSPQCLCDVPREDLKKSHSCFFNDSSFKAQHDMTCMLKLLFVHQTSTFSIRHSEIRAKLDFDSSPAHLRHATACTLTQLFHHHLHPHIVLATSMSLSLGFVTDVIHNSQKKTCSMGQSSVQFSCCECIFEHQRKVFAFSSQQ